jgi:hypothetical protein
MHNQPIKVNDCNLCGKSCRTTVPACHSAHDTGKFFELCSTSHDTEGQAGRNHYKIVEAADDLLDIIENKTALQWALNELRRDYDKMVKKGKTYDQVLDENSIHQV